MDRPLDPDRSPPSGSRSPSVLRSSLPPASTPAQTNDAGSEPVALVNFFQVLRRRRLVLLVCAVGGIAIAIGISATAQTLYTATAKLYFYDQMLTSQVFGSTVAAPIQDPAQTAATDLELAQLQSVAASTAHHLKSLTAAQVASKISVATDGQSRLDSVTATDPNPSLAAELANAYATEFVNFRRSFDRRTIHTTLRLITNQLDALPPRQQAGPVGRVLVGKISQLRILESLQTGNVQQVQQALVPVSPSSPKPVKDIVFGLVAGLIFGLGLTVLVDRIDRRLRAPDEAQHLFDRPLLGLIPNFGRRGIRRKPLLISSEPRVMDAFRLLRTNLRYFQLGRRISIVMTTSPEPGDGKTTVCWNLAAAAASARERVLLIEADLRHPASVGRRDIEVSQVSGSLSVGSPGLVQVLFGEATLAEALIPWSAGTGLPTFDVLFAGAIPPNPADLLESPAMSELLQSARDGYDLVVLDCPPVTLVSDAIPLLRAADGVMVVVSLGKSTSDSSRRLRLELEELVAPIFGIVANRVSVRETAYGSYYASPPTKTSEASGEPSGRLRLKRALKRAN